jgi:hypothetical protein
LAALVVSVYYPFNFRPRRLVRNTAVRTADGSLSIGSSNQARTAGTPAWLEDMRRSERIMVQLDAATGAAGAGPDDDARR